MSDSQNSSGPSQAVVPYHAPFPFVRVLYAIGFGFVAYFVLHVLFFLAVVQVVMFAINGRANEELKSFCSSLIQYEAELLGYISFARDVQPFPFGPFPKSQ
jgi:hypothetical protein